MHTPKAFSETDETILHQLIQDNPLATVITQSTKPDDVVANHIPLLLLPNEGKQGKLVGHVARVNPIWQNINVNAEHLAIFHGSDAYISPNWYPTKKEHGKVVPTWNYEVVHVRSHIRFIEDASWLHWQINALTEKHEEALLRMTDDMPWKVSDAPNEFINKLCNAIVGLEMTITSIIGKRKLSQNQPTINQNGVKQGLADLKEQVSNTK